MNRGRRLQPPPGVRVIELCPCPSIERRPIGIEERPLRGRPAIGTVNGLSCDEFERRYARVIYRGVEQLGLL